MPRKYGNHNDVIHAYFHGDSHPWNANTIFFDGDYLYSYGRHFWLAYRHRDTKTGKITYLINGDYYSVTTRCHQSKTQQAAPIRQSLTISANALAAANIDPETVVIKDRKKETFKDFHYDIEQDGKDFDQYIREVKQAGDDFIKDAPQGATVFYEQRRFYPEPGNTDVIKKVSLPRDYHRPASALLYRPRVPVYQWTDGGQVQNYRPGAYFVCGMDDNQYFISELPGRPQTVDQAFGALKPLIVKQAERDGKKIERQGEWFFIQEIKAGREARALYRQMHQNFDLTDQSDGEGASHIATRGAQAMELIFNNGYTFKARDLLVSGQIRHSRREHPMLGLSYAKQPEIWLAAINTARNSWSMGGNVD